MDEPNDKNSPSSEVSSDEALRASSERLSRIREESKRIVHDHSTKMLMDEGADNRSTAGVRLNGAAQQVASDTPNASAKQSDTFINLIINLALEENIRAMSRAVDDYIDDLRDEIDAAKVRRDQVASELEQMKIELRELEENRIAIKGGMDRIESGEELELDESSKGLKDEKLEKLVRGYEEKNGVQVDRENMALLLAVLQAEYTGMDEKQQNLTDSIKLKQEELNDRNDQISGLESGLTEAEAFRSELDQVSSISDKAEREVQLAKLMEDAPDNLLIGISEDENLSEKMRNHINHQLEEMEHSSNADELEVDSFLDEIISDEPDEAFSPSPPNPFR